MPQQFNPLGGDRAKGDFNNVSTYDPTTDTIHVLKAGDTMSGQLIFNSTSNGILFYNTTDLVNYERARLFWESNIQKFMVDANGTGILRPFRMGTRQGGNDENYIQLGGDQSPHVIFNKVFSTGYDYVGMTATLGDSGGVNSFLRITPTITQTTTNGYTAFKINITESTIGSGINSIIDASVGGVTRFNVSNLGNVTLSSTATGGLTLYNTTTQVTNYERVAMKWGSNVFNIVNEWNGTGTGRVLRIGTAAVAGTAGNSRFIEFNPTPAFYRFTFGGTGLTGNMVDFTGSTMSQASTNNVLMSFNPTITQTSTAGYTILDVNPTVSTTGSGIALLAAFRIGSVNKVTIDSTGKFNLALTNTYSVSNVTSNRVADPTTNTTAQNAQLLATLVQDLKAIGILN